MAQTNGVITISFGRAKPRLVPSLGGNHVMIGEVSHGFIRKMKGSDYFVVSLKGKRAEIEEIFSSRVLEQAR